MCIVYFLVIYSFYFFKFSSLFQNINVFHIIFFYLDLLYFLLVILCIFVNFLQYWYICLNCISMCKNILFVFFIFWYSWYYWKCLSSLARWPWARWPVGPLADGLWALGFGLRALGFGRWALAVGLWALGFGRWALALAWPTVPLFFSSISLPIQRSCWPPNILIIFKSIQVFGWRHRVQVAMPNMPCMWDFRVVKARTWIGRASSVHGGLRIQRRCQRPTLCWWLVRVRGRGLSAVGWFVSACGRGRRAVFFGCLTSLGFGIPPCSVELSPLSCGAVLLERWRVSLCVRVSSAMRFHGIGFEDSVFHWWKGRLAKRFRVEMSSADAGSVSNMLSICEFIFSFENDCCHMFDIVASRIDASRHDSCAAPSGGSCKYSYDCLKD